MDFQILDAASERSQLTPDAFLNARGNVRIRGVGIELQVDPQIARPLLNHLKLANSGP
jgi:hypothetical protein